MLNPPPEDVTMIPFLIITGIMVLSGMFGYLLLWYGRRVITSHNTWTDYGVRTKTSSEKFDPDETQDFTP